jgi:cellulose synthase/poly-beta-1,6-N-acetylglucosamine synthase-like glycosyltransferase
MVFFFLVFLLYLYLFCFVLFFFFWVVVAILLKFNEDVQQLPNSGNATKRWSGGDPLGEKSELSEKLR